MARDVSARLSNDSKCISSRLINEYVTRMNTKPLENILLMAIEKGKSTYDRLFLSFSANPIFLDSLIVYFVIKIQWTVLRAFFKQRITSEHN